MTALTHDEAVRRLRTALEEFDRGRGELQILSNVRWAAIDGFPECAPVYDVLVFDADRPAKLLPDGTAYGWRPSAVVAFDVIDRARGYEEEFYDKPDLLVQSGLQQYVLWDPSGEVMRPSLMIADRWDRGLRLVSTASAGVFFTEFGCRLDFSAEGVVASRSGCAWTETKLFNLRRIRETKLGDAKAMKGIDRKIRELEASRREEIARGNTEDGWSDVDDPHESPPAAAGGP